MPAGLPGDTAANNAGNPSAGRPVIIDALSGPKGSPFDAKKPVYNATAGAAFVSDTANISTGAMSTGIGFGLNVLINISAKTDPFTAPQAIKNAGFNDDGGEAAGANSTRVYIGGGKGTLSGGVYTPVPWTVGFVPVAAGNGGSRDGGTGPAFTGFTHKMVTATGSTANGVAIEAGFINRTGKTMIATESAFGSSTTAQVAAS